MATYPETKREEHFDRPLPSYEEGERAILGAILLDNQLILEAVETLAPEDFYSLVHRRIYSAMLKLFETGSRIDPILIGEILKRDGHLDSVGGISAISNLTSGVPPFADLKRYQQLVSERSLLRKLIRACNETIGEALDETDDAQVILDRAEQRIFNLAESRQREGLAHFGKIAERVFEKIRDFAKRDAHALTGLATGFRDLDVLTSGLQRSDLIIVAARPSMGKTAFCLNIAQKAAVQENAVVAIFSLEMSKDQIALRMLSAQASVNSSRLREGRLLKADWQRLAEAIGTLADSRIFIDDTPGVSVMEMRASLRRLVAQEKALDLVIVDYLQLMSAGTGRKSENRQQEVSQISRELKSLAKEFDVPVIALSQLSRAPETRNPPRPVMSDLRESGSIEQDADVIAFIYRPAYYHPNPDELPEEERNIAEINIAKQRNGPTDTIKLVFLRDFTRFEDLYNPNAAKDY
ncbi:MAG TPA: replicative DNA helicase [Pyrinomonadaceae bacterium]|nr:replicative DNA helicase [Pyrinomonadaceae bacterium]